MAISLHPSFLFRYHRTMLYSIIFPVYISVRDHFIYFFRGHTHFWSVFFFFFGGGASAENLAERRGGGEDSCTFFTAPESVIYFIIGLGVHKIIHVILGGNNWRAKKKWKKNCSHSARICSNLPEICLNSYIGKIGGGGAQCTHPPPPPRLLRICL